MLERSLERACRRLFPLSVTLTAEAVVPLLHIEVEMISVRLIGPWPQHSSKDAAGALMRAHHEPGSLLSRGDDVR